MLLFSDSSKGLVRHHNEDYHRYDRDRQLMILADGVGGQAHGEVASQIAVESAYQYMLRSRSLPDDEMLSDTETMKECISFANQKVLSQQRIKKSYNDMGTTLVVAQLLGRDLHTAWVGDSRLYVFRHSEQQLVRITKDHTLYQEMLDKNGVTENDSGHGVSRGTTTDLHPGHIITRVIGSMYNATPGYEKVRLETGDLVLLCTDGLTDMASEENIQQCLEKNLKQLHLIPNELVKLAYAGGASDNVTVIVGEIP